MPKLIKMSKSYTFFLTDLKNQFHLIIERKQKKKLIIFQT